jgi:hypothetical protein
MMISKSSPQKLFWLPNTHLYHALRPSVIDKSTCEGMVTTMLSHCMHAPSGRDVDPARADDMELLDEISRHGSEEHTCTLGDRRNAPSREWNGGERKCGNVTYTFPLQAVIIPALPAEFERGDPWRPRVMFSTWGRWYQLFFSFFSTLMTVSRCFSNDDRLCVFSYWRCSRSLLKILEAERA